MQIETYPYRGQQARLLWLAQKIASPITTEKETQEIIDTVYKTNPERARQLTEFREKMMGKK